MNVHEISNRQAWEHVAPKRGGDDVHVQGPKPEMPEAPADTSGTAGDGARGVLRLLQEGHFKGVADVRLRVVFHERLEQLAQQRGAEAFGDGIGTLAADLKTKVHELLPGADEAELAPLLDEFTKAAGQAAEQLKAGGTDLEASVEALRAAFADVLRQLEERLASAPATMVEDTEDGTTTVDIDLTPLPGEPGEAPLPEETASPGTANPLQGLEEWFASALATVQEGASSAQALPPLSPPHGNGGAYAKFLEAYERLNTGVGGEAAVSDTHEAVDAQV